MGDGPSAVLTEGANGPLEEERVGTAFQGGGLAEGRLPAEPPNQRSPPRVFRAATGGAAFSRVRGFRPKKPWFTQPRRCVGKRQQSSSPSYQVKVILCRK